MKGFLRRFASNTIGATSVEYALIAIGVALAIIVGVGLIGTNLDATYRNVATEIGKGGG